MQQRQVSATLIDSERTADGHMMHLQFAGRVTKAGDLINLFDGHGPYSTIPEVNPRGFHVYVPVDTKHSLQLDEKAKGLELLTSSPLQRYSHYKRLLLVAEGMDSAHAMISLLKCIQRHSSSPFARAKRLRIVWIVRLQDRAKVEWMLKSELDQEKLYGGGGGRRSVQFSIHVTRNDNNEEEWQAGFTKFQHAVLSMHGNNWPIEFTQACPDWNFVLQAEATMGKCRNRCITRRIGIFTCISPELLRQVQQAAAKLCTTTTCKIAFTVHQGNFDN